MYKKIGIVVGCICIVKGLCNTNVWILTKWLGLELSWSLLSVQSSQLLTSGKPKAEGLHPYPCTRLDQLQNEET